jgi:hypothetical protein
MISMLPQAHSSCGAAALALVAKREKPLFALLCEIMLDKFQSSAIINP